MNTILEGLKKYFQNTDKDQIVSDWAEFKEYDNIGPAIGEFIRESSIIYEIESKMSYWEFLFPNTIQNPEFSSDFFLTKFKFIL
ncbi:hypothetical protein Dfri01_01920 [Dyadobacter frigoris]|nr:hypothetical protein Dfri01_01920 [Dyadobacter frigoris]